MRDVPTRVLILIIGAGNALVGPWATFAPESFFDNFPGGGRHWVAVDGPFNEHLVRDVGSLNMALVAVAIAALVRPSRYLLQVLAIAELVYAVPHFVYHAANLDHFGSSDKVALMVSLSVTIVAPVALLVFSSRASDQAITKVA
ncbi:MAG: hypothetical protein QOC92_2585 [Acidimicrobiaceae bacterium]|jgi:hypothetical protein